MRGSCFAQRNTAPFFCAHRKVAVVQWEALAKYLIDVYVPTGKVLVDRAELADAERRLELVAMETGQSWRIEITQKASGK